MKVQWLRLPKISPKALRAASDRILASEYSDEKGLGFTTKEVRPSYILGTFIQKVEVTEIVEDPYGMEVENQHVEYRRTSFRISLTKPELEIVIPSKGLNVFIGQLSLAFSMDLRIDPITIDPFMVFDSLKAVNESCQVHAAKIQEIKLSSQVVAKCTITGTTNVRPFIDRIAKGIPKEISAVKVIQEDSNGRYSCDIRRDGSVLFYGTSDQIFLPPLRKIVADLI